MLLNEIVRWKVGMKQLDRYEVELLLQSKRS